MRHLLFGLGLRCLLSNGLRIYGCGEIQGQDLQFAKETLVIATDGQAYNSICEG
jgi:hypothetical protein